ncbi:MAG: hypothetical protein V4628_07330 [Pseudomonadota bacterium]
MNKEILKQKVKNLSGHMYQDVQTFRGRQPVAVKPKFTWQQLVPVVVVLAGIGILIASPKTRNSMAVKFAMLLSSQFLQRGDTGDADEPA